MYKVMIVDDEPFVREGLKALIPWQEYGFEVHCEAENGLEAIDKFQRERPDVVIADVKMPKINGLDMIKYFRQTMKTRTKYIILSGYNEFEYARQAIRCGVVRYLLKPIDEDELIEALLDISEMLKREEREQKQKRFLYKASAGDIIKRLIRGEINNEILQIIKDHFGMDIETEFAVFMIDVGEAKHWGGELTEEQMHDKLAEIEAALADIMDGERAVFFFDELRYCYCIVASWDTLARYGGREIDFAERIYQQLDEKTGFKAAIAIGKRVRSIYNLGEAYNTCLEAAYRRAFSSGENIVLFDEMQHFTPRYDISSELPLDEIIEAVESRDAERIKLLVDQLFERLHDERLAPEIVNASIISLELDILKVICEMKGNVIEFARHLKNISLDSLDLIASKKEFESFCLKASEYMGLLRAQHSGDIMDEVESYVKSNYNKDISLKSVAERFYISPVYLGQLFKKRFGVYFKDYLHNLRIEEAKRLLRKTDLKVYEIAFEVGYSDPNYFINKFKKYTQLTPLEYKEKII